MSSELAVSLLRIGISACLLGEEVRYDGAHRRCEQILDYFADRIEWVSVCPEVELGMGVPRETIELVAAMGGVRLLGSDSRTDHTARMRRWAAKRLKEIEGISGYILKARSPSCGLRNVAVSGATERVSGIFAAALVERFPRLPIVEDEDMADARSLADFAQRVEAYARQGL